MKPILSNHKIVIIGPESTGKSMLAQRLAERFNSVWVQEYAREYLLQHGTRYTYNDLMLIARGQLELEDELAARHPGKPLFIDTNMYVMKVWYEVVFGNCPPFIEEEIKRRKYDLYLLCAVDLPWVQDELREYPELETRQALFDRYETLLQNQTVPWAVISGSNEERVDNAVAVIESHFNTGK